MVRKNSFFGRAFLDYCFIFLLLFISFVVVYAGVNIFSLSGALAVQSSSTISPSLVVIFDGFDSGGTNFSLIGTQDLDAVPNVSLVKGASSLFFHGVVNMSADGNSSDRVANLSAYINITNTSISLDSVHLPNLNRSARITFRGLSFVNPVILLDGSSCPSTVCTTESYSGGNFTFNVSHFTTYSVVEGSEVQAPQSVGGGGGSSAVVQKSFTVMNVSKIPYVVKQGGFSRGEFTILNTMTESRKYSLSTSLPGILFFDESDVVLLPGESHTFAFTMVAQEYASPAVYSAKVKVDDGFQFQEFSLLITVQERLPLFDVSVATSDDFREYILGVEKIPINISLQNLGDSYLLDVFLKVQLMDTTGVVLSEQTESVAVNKLLSVTRNVFVPKDLLPEEYIVVVTATYEGRDAVGGVLIRIVSSSESETRVTTFVGKAIGLSDFGVKEWVLVVMGVIFFIVSFIFFVVIVRRNVHSE